MANPFILGLTGSLGSGKSFLSSLFSRIGAQVICADRLAHEAVEAGSEALQEISREFGSEVINPDGSLHRAKMAEIVFSDPSRRLLLEQIIHPRVRARIVEQVRKLEGNPLIVLDVPLLFESGLHRLCTAVLAVTISDDERLRRMVADRQMAPDEVQKRLAAQMPEKEKAVRAEYVIDNSRDRSGTCRQLSVVLQRIFPAGLPAPLRSLDCSKI